MAKRGSSSTIIITIAIIGGIGTITIIITTVTITTTTEIEKFCN
jgi:hypothetical protein